MEKIGENIVAFLPVETIEPQALQQIKNTASMPFLYRHVAVMPDAHYGRGSVRHQRSLDRTDGLNKGEFLAHRNVHRSEDETANPTIEGTG